MYYNPSLSAYYLINTVCIYIYKNLFVCCPVSGVFVCYYIIINL